MYRKEIKVISIIVNIVVQCAYINFNVKKWKCVSSVIIIQIGLCQSVTCVFLKELDTMVALITDINHSILIHCYSTRAVKLSWSISLSAK